MNVNNLMSGINGSSRNITAMKEHVRQGYDAVYTTEVNRYDELGSPLYPDIAENLLSEVDLKGKKILDVGCGTGVSSLRAVQQGASEIVCVDQSTNMLSRCQAKLKSQAGQVRSSFLQLDADKLQFDEKSFDVVISSMMLGFMPNQVATLSEMRRVLRPGGTLAIATHGTAFQTESVWAFIRGLPPRHMKKPYRIEFWPRGEKAIQRFLAKAGLEDIHTKRHTLQETFASPAAAFAAMEATSGLWMMTNYPRAAADEITAAYRKSFERYKVDRLTHDVVFGYGRRPAQ